MPEHSPSFPAAERNGIGRGSSAAAIPLPILLLLLLVIMVPIELSFSIGGLFLTASRAYLVLMTFMLLPYLGSLKLRWFDWFFILHVFWTVAAYLQIYPLGQAIEMAGSYGLEMLIVYLAVRIYLQNVEQMKNVILLIFALVFVSGVLAIPETRTGIRYVHELATAITGNTYRQTLEMRMGIYRSQSFFEHPILYGIFCASSFGLVWFASTPLQRLYRAPIIAIATWFSASSAPILTLIVQLALLIPERFTRKFKRRDKILALVAVSFVGVMQIFTGRGVVGIVTLLTINPGTAYTRRAQWNYAIDDVMRNPWFGFQPGLYTRPFWLAPSIDNWWLGIMMRSGIPALILLALCALFMWIAIARRQGPPVFNQVRTGWGVSMIGIILGAATVAYFGKLQPLFAFYMGMGAALATCYLPGKDAPAPVPLGRRTMTYTRFPTRPSPLMASATRQGITTAMSPGREQPIVRPSDAEAKQHPAGIAKGPMQNPMQNPRQNSPRRNPHRPENSPRDP